MPMCYITGLFTALLVTWAMPAVAQKPEKLDSLRIVLRAPRDSAAQLIASAFLRSGLTITDATGFYIESDQGETMSSGISSILAHRVVRAGFYSMGDSTTILITGDEVRRSDNSNRGPGPRLRIDNRAGNDGQKVWCMMVAAAVILDSTQVPPAAFKPGKCK